MSYDYDDDATDEGPKALRELVKKLQRDLEKVTGERDTFASKAKEADRVSVFTKLNIPPKIQRWMKDVDGTEEAVKQWVAENGEDFGFKLGEQETAADKPSEGQQVPAQEAPTEPAVPSVLTPEDIANLTRIQGLLNAGTGQTTLSDQSEQAVAAVESQLGPNATMDQLIAALAAQGVPIESSR